MTILNKAAACLLALGIIASCSRTEPARPPTIDAKEASDSRDSRAGWPQRLTIGLAGGTDLETALEYNKPLQALLEKATGLPVELFIPTVYSAVVEGMRAKRVDAMQVGVFSYLLAVQEANAEAVAVAVPTYAEPPVYDPSLQPEYYSVISVKKGSGITSLRDLKGRSLNFVEPASTSGHLVPKTDLIKAGLLPDKDLKTVFAGSHGASLIALWNGKSDAAASVEMIFRSIARGGQIEYCGFPDATIGRRRSKEDVRAIFEACPVGKVVAIHYSDPIPGTPIAVRADLPDDLKTKIKAALLSTSADPEFIKNGKRWYVDPTEQKGLPNLDAYYNGMREIAKLLDLDLKALE